MCVYMIFHILDWTHRSASHKYCRLLCIHHILNHIVNIRDMTHSFLRHDSFVYVTGLTEVPLARSTGSFLNIIYSQISYTYIYIYINIYIYFVI